MYCGHYAGAHYQWDFANVPAPLSGGQKPARKEGISAETCVKVIRM